MWELWFKTRHGGWSWRVIGAVAKGDLADDVHHLLADATVTDIRVLSDAAERPGVIA
jgi:hypothetical protein